MSCENVSAAGFGEGGNPLAKSRHFARQVVARSRRWPRRTALALSVGGLMGLFQMALRGMKSNPAGEPTQSNGLIGRIRLAFVRYVGEQG
jgi:hypothetical protein